MSGPPRKHVRIDLLIDDPLLTGMPKAEVARLSPRSKMDNSIVAIGGESLERTRVRQVAIARPRCIDLVAARDERTQERRAKKSTTAGDKVPHVTTLSGSTGK